MSEAPLLVVAGGGHGRVVIDALRLSGATIAGIVDPGLDPGARVLGVPVRGGDDWLDAQPAASYRLVNGIGLAPGSDRRERLYLERVRQGHVFVGVCHPSAVIGLEVLVAGSAQLLAGVVLQSGARIGNNAVVNTRAVVEHDCVVGDHAFVGPGAVLCGAVGVGRSAFVGAGAVVLPGIRIGARAVVGAGAVVVADVDEGVRVVGNPAACKYKEGR